MYSFFFSFVSINFLAQILHLFAHERNAIKSRILPTRSKTNPSLKLCSIKIAHRMTYWKAASSRLVYYSLLDHFVQRSQYISMKIPLHKQFVGLLLTETAYCSRLYGIQNDFGFKVGFLKIIVSPAFDYAPKSMSKNLHLSQLSPAPKVRSH